MTRPNTPGGVATNDTSRQTIALDARGLPEGYLPMDLLGEGAFGKVYRVRGPGGFEGAMKVVRLESGGRGASEWHKEFQSISLVRNVKKHNNLVQYQGVWLHIGDGRFITNADHATPDVIAAAPSIDLLILMELCDKTLAQRMREYGGGIPPRELIEYMMGAAKGLDHLHKPIHDLGEGAIASIIHRDIKPANLLIFGEDVKVADYGVARAVVADQRQTGSISGSPAYAPPEIYANAPCPASDQYSLAVTYYELRTGGTLPVDEMRAMMDHISGKLNFSLVPPAEQQVLRRATHAQPNRRFATCREFVEALWASAPAGPPMTQSGTVGTNMVVRPAGSGGYTPLTNTPSGGHRPLPGSPGPRTTPPPGEYQPNSPGRLSGALHYPQTPARPPSNAYMTPVPPGGSGMYESGATIQFATNADEVSLPPTWATQHTGGNRPVELIPAAGPRPQTWTEQAAPPRNSSPTLMVIGAAVLGLGVAGAGMFAFLPKPNKGEVAQNTADVGKGDPDAPPTKKVKEPEPDPVPPTKPAPPPTPKPGYDAAAALKEARTALNGGLTVNGLTKLREIDGSAASDAPELETARRILGHWAKVQGVAAASTLSPDAVAQIGRLAATPVADVAMTEADRAALHTYTRDTFEKLLQRFASAPYSAPGVDWSTSEAWQNFLAKLPAAGAVNPPVPLLATVRAECAAMATLRGASVQLEDVPPAGPGEAAAYRDFVDALVNAVRAESGGVGERAAAADGLSAVLKAPAAAGLNRARAASAGVLLARTAETAWQMDPPADNPFGEPKRAAAVKEWLAAVPADGLGTADRALLLVAAGQGNPDAAAAGRALGSDKPESLAAALASEKQRPAFWLAYARTRDLATPDGFVGAAAGYAKLVESLARTDAADAELLQRLVGSDMLDGAFYKAVRAGAGDRKQWQPTYATLARLCFDERGQSDPRTQQALAKTATKLAEIAGDKASPALAATLRIESGVDEPTAATLAADEKLAAAAGDSDPAGLVLRGVARYVRAELGAAYAERVQLTIKAAADLQAALAKMPESKADRGLREAALEYLARAQLVLAEFARRGDAPLAPGKYLSDAEGNAERLSNLTRRPIVMELKGQAVAAAAAGESLDGRQRLRKYAEAERAYMEAANSGDSRFARVVISSRLLLGDCRAKWAAEIAAQKGAAGAKERDEKYAAAQDDFKVVLRANSTPAQRTEAYVQLGRISKAMGNADQAQAFFKKANDEKKTPDAQRWRDVASSEIMPLEARAALTAALSRGTKEARVSLYDKLNDFAAESPVSGGLQRLLTLREGYDKAPAEVKPAFAKKFREAGDGAGLAAANFESARDLVRLHLERAKLLALRDEDSDLPNWGEASAALDRALAAAKSEQLNATARWRLFANDAAAFQKVAAGGGADAAQLAVKVFEAAVDFGATPDLAWGYAYSAGNLYDTVLAGDTPGNAAWVKARTRAKELYEKAIQKIDAARSLPGANLSELDGFKKSLAGLRDAAAEALKSAKSGG